MGLLMISIVFGGVLGCLIWLGVGDRLPVQKPQKWSMATNILIYAASSMFVIYIVIFFWA
jgi:hypothetical protein